jgi:hypothetical protein
MFYLSYETMWNGGFVGSGVMAPSVALCRQRQSTRRIFPKMKMKEECKEYIEE